MLFYSLNYSDLVRLESDFEVINKEKGALATQLSCTHTELATLRSELDSKIGKHKKLDGSFHSVVYNSGNSTDAFNMDMDQLEEEDQPFITVAHHQFPVETCELDKAIKKFKEMEKDFKVN